MKKLFWVIILTSISVQSQVINVESLRMVTDTTGWAGSVGLNLDVYKNTRDLLRIKNHIHVQYKTPKHLILFMNSISFDRAGGAEFVNKGVQHLRYNYRIKPRLNWEAFVQNQYNAISKIAYRRLAGTGPRYKLLNSDKYKMYLGSLFMYEYEKTTEDVAILHQDWRNSSYFSFSFFFTKNVKLVSTTYYQPKLSLIDDYRVAHQSALYLKLYKNLSFKTTFKYNYDTFPVEGIPNVDYGLTNGLMYKF